jgi:hypothetical protein
MHAAAPILLVLHLAALSVGTAHATPATPATLGASAAGPSTATATPQAKAVGAGIRPPGAGLQAAPRQVPAATSAAPMPVRLAYAAPVSDGPVAAVTAGDAGAERPTITPGSGALAALAMLVWIVARRHRPD